MLTKSLEGLEEQARAESPGKVPFAHRGSSRKLKGEEPPPPRLRTTALKNVPVTAAQASEAS